MTERIFVSHLLALSNFHRQHSRHPQLLRPLGLNSLDSDRLVVRAYSPIGRPISSTWSNSNRLSVIVEGYPRAIGPFVNQRPPPAARPATPLTHSIRRAVTTHTPKARLDNAVTCALFGTRAEQRYRSAASELIQDRLTRPPHTASGLGAGSRDPTAGSCGPRRPRRAGRRAAQPDRTRSIGSLALLLMHGQAKRFPDR